MGLAHKMARLYISQRLLKDFGLTSSFQRNSELELLYQGLKTESKKLIKKVKLSDSLASGNDGMRYYFQQWEDIKKISGDEHIRLVCLFSLTWCLMTHYKASRDYASLCLIATCFGECDVTVKKIEFKWTFIDISVLAFLIYAVWTLLFRK